MTLLLAMLTATTAWAQSSFSGGSGTKADPYKISSSDDLVQLATDINNSTSRLYEDQYFVQTGDIDMSGINFVPIGLNDDKNNHKFRSNYNGQNYTISNLTVNGSYDYAGLFGYIYNGDIDNVRLVSPSITNTKTGYTGALVGYGNMPGIHNCLVINPTLSGGNSIGVFAGKQAAGNIQYTYYTGNNNYSNVGSTDGSNANTSIGHAYALTLSGGATTSTTAAFTYNSTDYYAGTITLSNAAPAGWIYAYTVNGSPIDGTSFTINADATVALSRTPDPTHFSVNDAGTEYTIHTADGWSVFCDCLDDNDTYNRFSGKTVRLGDNITVSRMAGSSYHDFCGTFDGGGHTLTVNISSDDITDGSTQYVAPFRYVTSGDSPATIRNLHVTGTITTDKQFTGGLIGGCWGTVIVENCAVSTAITSTISGDGTHGGIVGIQQNGALTITGCLFDGSLLGATTYAVGGFLGWRKSGAEIRNSLFAPAEVTVLNTSGATFARNKIDTYNSYYTYYLCDGTNYVPVYVGGTETPNLWRNGKATHTVAAGTDVTIEAVDITSGAVWYNVSGIVAYSSGGLYRDGNLYYGSDDQLSLTLSNTATGAPQGYQYGYTASAGTLDGTTLTMPDQDVTISAALAPIDWATVNQGDSEEDPYMIYNKDQLLLLAHRVNGTSGETANDYKGKYFKLGADITFSHPDNETDNYAENYEAIGSYIGDTYRFFKGKFDGDGYTVSGIRIRKDGTDYADIYQGLFGLIGSGAEIHDVHLTDARITGYYQVGGIVGYNNAGYIMRCSVTDSYITATRKLYYGTICGSATNTIRLSNNYYHGCTVNGTAVTSGMGCHEADIADNHGALPAYRLALGDGVSTTALASAPENGFVYNGVSYYRNGLALPLASTLGSEAPEGYTLSFSANGTALSGNTYTVNATDGDVTITAAFRSDGQPHEVSYVDADGTARTAQAIALDGYETVGVADFVHLAAGTYYVGTDIAYANLIWLDGDVTIILADGKTMTLNGNTYGIHGGHDLTIYGQSLDDATAGTLRYDGSSRGIYVNNYVQHSGNVSITTSDFLVYGINAKVTLRGGTLTVTADGINARAITGTMHSILGGQLTATGTDAIGIYASASSGTAITLGWTRPDDRITASSISTEGGTVAVADGQALTDGSGHIYTGTLTDDEISAIAGKTLRPCISYLDSDGETQYCADYTVLTGNETELDNTDGWYVAAGTLNYDHTLTISADVNLILTDGCQMNFGTSESRLDCYGINYTGYPTLNIYGQSTGNDMGTLSAYTTGNETHAIRAYCLSINGGNVVANAIGDDANGLDVYDDLIVNDGNVIATATGYSATAISTEYDLNVNGGNVTATANGESAFAICVAMNKFEVNGGKVMVTVTGDNATAICHHTEYRSLFAGGTITVMGANDDGNIYLNGATVTFSSFGGYMEVGEGLFYTDGEGNSYFGELTSSEMSAIAGKTLSPSSAVSLADTDAELNQKLLALDGVTLDVTLANRTIDTEWNTLTVPFNVTYWQLIETFGKGVKLYELTGSSLVGDVLGLEFTSATSIEAGKPYFIKASADVQNPTFRNVTIDASANNPSETDYVDFIPTLGVTTVEGSDLREVLVLGGGNTLYNPSVLPAMMKGFRGFFRVHDEVVANAAQFRMSFAEESDVTGIIDVQVKNEELRNKSCDAVYNLMGQRVNAATAREIHVVKGKRVIRP